MADRILTVYCFGLSMVFYMIGVEHGNAIGFVVGGILLTVSALLYAVKDEETYRGRSNRPSLRYTLERRDNNSGYCKNNCLWDTISNQNRNRRSVTYLSWFTTEELVTEAKRRNII